MLKNNFYVVLFCILLSVPINSQTPSFFHYTSADGLASSTVYDILQDKNGFIWFATANGISKFDGNKFTTFRTKDGLNSNSIIALANGMNGELFFGNYAKGINVLRDGNIQNYYSEINGSILAISYLISIQSSVNEQTIYAYQSWGAINTIIHNRTADPINTIFYPSPILINKLALLKNGKLIAATTNGLFNFEHNELVKLEITGLPDVDFHCLAENEDGSYLIGGKNKIYRISDNTVIKRYDVNPHNETGISHIFCDSNGNIWFSIMNKGFYFIPKGSENITDIGSKMGLQNTLVNNYFEDNEGNIWISAFGKGVFCLNNLFLKTYNENNGLSSNNIYSIVKDKSGVVLLGTFNGINILQNNICRNMNSSQNSLTEYIHFIKNIDDDYYIGASRGNSKIGKVNFEGKNLYFFDRPSFSKTIDGLYLFGTSGNSVNISKDFYPGNSETFELFIMGDTTSLNRVNDIYEDTEKNVWLATTKGLCKLSNLSITAHNVKVDKSYFPNDHVLSARINHIIQDSQNNVWFAGENGIAKYNLLNDSVDSYSSIFDYDLSSSTSLVIDDNERLWIGNMQGLYLFDGHSIKFLNSRNGLPSNEVLSLYYDAGDDSLYIGTSNGLSILSIGKFDGVNLTPPNVNVTSLQTGDSAYTKFDNLVFQPSQHDIKIDFAALNFSSPGTVQYKYKFNDEWMTTNSNFLNFIALTGGTYVLELMAKSQNTDWGKPTFLTFRIESRFTETLWFYTGIAAITIIFTLFIITGRMRLKNKKITAELELSERINELKHQALSAMMNPHFTFNALNSVQYLINVNRNEEANNYIAMMSKLIRKNLDTAGSGFILLSEEIDRLQLYLDLEKLRFQENISYEIAIGNDIDPQLVMIPNMIIQPFVENSLWHGIINPGKKGMLTVSFTFEDVDYNSLICKSLVIKITDNGVGISNTIKNKPGDHISKGIQIIEERLKLLSTKMQLPKPIMFEDLSSRSYNSHGTEVIISLPPPLYKIAERI